MTICFRRTWLLSTVAFAGLAFVASGLTVRAATPQKEEKASKEGQAKKESQEAAELEKIEVKLRGLEGEIKELRAAGKDEAAEKLAREGRELKAALQKQDAGKDKKDVGGLREGEAQLKRLAAEIEELKAAGKLDAAEKLEREARQLKEKLGKRGDGDAKKTAEPSKEIAAKIDAMQHEAAKLREAGRTEEAEKILRQVAELREHLEKGRGKGQKEKPVKDGEKVAVKYDLPSEAKEKIERAKRQLEELREAGKKEQAEAVAREIEAYVKRLQDEAATAKKEKGPLKGPAPETQDKSKGQNELAMAVRELRREVEKLRDEVAELRRLVKEPRKEPRGEKGEKKEDERKEGEKKDGEKKDSKDKD